MALTFPTVNGNWSNSAIWSGSTLPTINDDVYANNKTVIIDQNVSVKSIRNTASGSAVVNGTFIVSGSFTITTTDRMYTGGNILLTVSNDTSSIVNINSIIDMSQQNIGTGGLLITGSGIVNMVGDLLGSGNNNQTGLQINNRGTTNIVGNIYGSNASFGLAYAMGIGNSGATVNITGDLIPRISGNSYNIINFTTSCSLNITGNIYTLAGYSATINPTFFGTKISIIGTIFNNANPAQSPVYLLGISQSVDLTGNIFASLTFPAVTVASPTSTAILRGVNLVNSFQNPGFSRVAISCPSMTIVPSNQFRWTFYNAPSSSLNSTMFVQGYVPDSPSQADVRFGTTYLAGALSGSVQMPQPNQVISGVKTDNTTGSYDVTVAALTEAVWSKLTSTLTGSNTIGERLKNNSTVDSTGQQLQALI